MTTRPRVNYLDDATPQYRAILLDRMMAKIDANGPCWEWTGYRHSQWGYAIIRVNTGGQNCVRLAHNILHELLIGPTPTDLEPDHLCMVKHCVNVGEHIQYVTHAENMRRCHRDGGSRNRRRTECPRCGGPYDGLSREGWRRCSACTATSAALRALSR